jgi:hypothetical protein
MSPRCIPFAFLFALAFLLIAPPGRPSSAGALPPTVPGALVLPGAPVDK